MSLPAEVRTGMAPAAYLKPKHGFTGSDSMSGPADSAREVSHGASKLGCSSSVMGWGPESTGGNDVSCDMCVLPAVGAGKMAGLGSPCSSGAALSPRRIRGVSRERGPCSTSNARAVSFRDDAVRGPSQQPDSDKSKMP